MAHIEVAPLTERLSEEEIEELAAALASAGAPKLPAAGDGVELTVAEGIDEDVLDDFLDRLDALEAACDIYLPTEFEGCVSVGDMQVGSTAHLLEALEELKDELLIDADEDEDDEDEEDDDDEDETSDDASEIMEAKLKSLWKLFHTGATEATNRHLPLHIVG